MLVHEPIRATEPQSRPQRDTAADAVRRAFDLLSRASADWRNGDSRGAAALHWPVALALARSEIGKALEALNEHGQECVHAPENCRGHLDALDCFSDDDARAGLAWYNSATVTERRHWHQVARSAVPSEAWEAYKAGGQP